MHRGTGGALLAEYAGFLQTLLMECLLNGKQMLCFLDVIFNFNKKNPLKRPLDNVWKKFISASNTEKLKKKRSQFSKQSIKCSSVFAKMHCNFIWNTIPRYLHKKENNWKITRKNKLQKHNTTRIISHKLDLTVIKDEFVNTTFIKLGNHQHDVKL